ncbi:lactate racemase domain-containing protein [Chloroflexota bacterium]
MAGYDRPALTPAEIKASINNSLDTAPIRELAKDKKEVVIIFDDITRVTRTAQILPFILEDLAAAGIPDDRIRLIVALGLHSAMWRQHFVKKLGEDIVSRFRIYNHNPFHNCTYAGTTATYKTKVYANAEVMKCDFRIVIGTVVPHAMIGFGGGGKIILPGIVSYETTHWNHEKIY